MKKILCLALLVVVLASAVLTSCDKKDDTDAGSNEPEITITE